MPQVSKILKFGLEDDVIELRAKGLGTREIAQRLSDRIGKEISHMSIYNYLRCSKDITTRTITKKEQLRERLANQQLDIFQQLIDVNKIVKRKIEELENTTEHRHLLGYLKEIRGQTELIAKLLGELSPSCSISIKQNLSLQQNMFQLIESLHEEELKKLVIFLIEEKNVLSNINHMEVRFFIGRMLKTLAEHGILYMKPEDEETVNIIEGLEKSGKLKIEKVLF